MIVGIGNDLVDIRRIEKSLKRFGERFENKIFTHSEIAKAKQKANPKAQAATFAKRFAAKEACAKALGVGLGKISWREIEVANDELGKPSLKLSGNAALHLQNLAAGKNNLGAKLPHPNPIPVGEGSYGKAVTGEGIFINENCRIHLSLSDEYPYAQAFVVIEASC